jgi:hypothetical protein
VERPLRPKLLIQQFEIRDLIALAVVFQDTLRRRKTPGGIRGIAEGRLASQHPARPRLGRRRRGIVCQSVVSGRECRRERTSHARARLGPRLRAERGVCATLERHQKTMQLKAPRRARFAASDDRAIERFEPLHHRPDPVQIGALVAGVTFSRSASITVDGANARLGVTCRAATFRPARRIG